MSSQLEIVVVGGGILGTMHAWFALAGGHRVTHLEKDAAPRGASVRNFGLIWVSGRAEGEELETALRARHFWGEIGQQVPETGFRECGSLTIASNASEHAVLEEAAARPDASARGFVLLEPDEVRRRNPALQGDFVSGLWCGLDAATEPAQVLGQIRSRMDFSDDYRFVPATEVHVAEKGGVIDHRGKRYAADVVILCTGADHSGLAGPYLMEVPIRRVFLHMMETEPLDEPFPTALADGDSLRYYPAFAGPALDRLPAQTEPGGGFAMQLLVVQRSDGALTVGDTHLYQEPFDFAEDEAPYSELVHRLQDLLGRKAPPIRRRWHGVYSQATSGDVVHRAQIEPDVWLVTGPGGRGHTMSPAIAEKTLAEAVA